MEFAGIGLVAIIVGLNEIIKKLGVNEKFIPVVSLVLGLGAGYLVGTDVKEIIVLGLMMGLSACGLYSGTKNVVQGVKGQ